MLSKPPENCGFENTIVRQLGKPWVIFSSARPASFKCSKPLSAFIDVTEGTSDIAKHQISFMLQQNAGHAPDYRRNCFTAKKAEAVAVKGCRSHGFNALDIELCNLVAQVRGCDTRERDQEDSFTWNALVEKAGDTAHQPILGFAGSWASEDADPARFRRGYLKVRAFDAVTPVHVRCSGATNNATGVAPLPTPGPASRPTCR